MISQKEIILFGGLNYKEDSCREAAKGKDGRILFIMSPNQHKMLDIEIDLEHADIFPNTA